jgi:hypothetical protein
MQPNDIILIISTLLLISIILYAHKSILHSRTKTALRQALGLISSVKEITQGNNQTNLPTEQ